MSSIFIYVDHNWHFYVCKLMISVGNLSILSDFLTHFWPKCSTAVSMATAVQMDERIADYLVLGPNTQDRKVSAKSVTMRATALCKNLSGYRELLLSCHFFLILTIDMFWFVIAIFDLSSCKLQFHGQYSYFRKKIQML